MKIDALDHPKTLDFASRLGIELPAAIGHLELLWAFTGKKAPQGNIGKWPDGAIARACYWMGSPEVFITALRDAGFLDTDPTHRLIIHDWQEHAPRWVRSKLHSLKLQFVGGKSKTDTDDDKSDDVSPDISRDTSADSKGFASKCSPSKGSSTVAARPSEPEFSELKAIYPKRSGGNPWQKAMKAIHARIREGCSWQEILDGTRRYAAHIRAKGDEGTQFVMQAATFCGPEKHFLETWIPPPSKAQRQQDANVEAGLKWLESQETDHATQ